ncbi:MAG TPA: histidine kinase [Vicinamibacterales bacterium]|nr:histidine kinase [Vicinamibacterales bacterium]
MSDRPRPLWRRPAVWAAAAGFGAFVFPFKFFYKYLDDVARGEAGTAAQRLIEEATGAAAAIPVFVAIVVVACRLPVDRPGGWRRVPAHLAALVATSILHTTLNWWLRVGAFAAAGLGSYDYGDMPVRYLMELPNDVLSYAGVLALVTLFRWYQRLRDREVDAARLERSLSEARLESLRLQIQPHFLFNALNAISSTMYDNPQAADEMIERLSELLRVSLRTARTQQVPLDEELVALDHYVALMKARFGDALDVRINIEGSAIARRALVPSMVLQPLVENAIRHGRLAHEGRGRVDVHAAARDGHLDLSVTDDGPGVSPAVGRGDGVGLDATRQRLRLLYGDECTFSAGHVPGGFAVRMSLPLLRGADAEA